MHKLLIAEGNEELRQALVRDLSDAFVVKACADGAQARLALRELQPDILLLDLMLPCVDGITLLKEARAADLRPVTLVTLSFVSDYILSALQKYDVAYLMSKPCSTDALVGQIRELAATLDPAAQTAADPAIPLSAMLTELRLSPKLDGFQYLLLAIPLYMLDPRQALTKELYTAVGHRCGKSGQQVERSIRTAIHSAWLKGDKATWQRYFPTAPDGSVPRPSNGDFIARISACLSEHFANRSA